MLYVLSIGIIGIGKWGKNLLREFYKLNIKIKCTNKSDENNRRWIKKEFPTVEIADNYLELLNDGSIDAIIIATPIPTHYRIAKESLLAGKHVFVEKPMTDNINEAEELIKLAKENRKNIFVGNIYLHHQIFHKLKDILKTEKLKSAHFIWNRLDSSEEDIALNLGIHGIYLANEFFGSPSEVRMFHKASDGILSFSVNYDNERKCIIQLNRLAQSKSTHFLFFTDKNIYLWDDATLYKLKEEIYEKIYESTESPLALECKAFISAIEKNNYESAYIGLNSLKIAKLVCNKKIAVVGAGIYGITIALKLSQYFNVDLFEKNEDILTGASGINQYRLHRGYHYPRSNETAETSLKSQKPFADIYGEAITMHDESFYCLAKDGSRTSREKFIEFCNRHNLWIEETDTPLINTDKTQLIVKVKENCIDIHKLKNICIDKLKNSNINLILNKEVELASLKDYDYVINCTYANINSLVKEEEKRKEYKFQLCEKPVVKLPKSLIGKSFVILDGQFMCLDKFGNSGLGIMGNVVHAVHHSNIGKFPEVPDEYKDLLNRGIIKNPPKTNFSKFIESAAEFIPEIKKVEHVGSMYTIRTTLPNVELTDERPLIVKKIDDRVINVFAGKLSGCVIAADEVFEMLTNQSL